MTDQNKKVDTSHVPAWAKDIGRNVSKSQIVGLDGNVIGEGLAPEWEKHLIAALGDAGKKHAAQLKGFDLSDNEKAGMAFGILRMEAPSYCTEHQAEDPRFTRGSGAGFRR